MAAAKKTAAAETMETWTAAFPDSMKDGYENFAKGFSDFAEIQQEAAKAWMNSVGVVAKAFETAAADQSAFVKAAYEDGLAAAKSAAASKSVQDAVEIQSEYARAQFERNVAHASKLADHWLTAGKEASEPLTERYGAIVEKMQAFRP